MATPTRSASPGAARAMAGSDGAKDDATNGQSAKAETEQEKAPAKFETPPRPRGLRDTVLGLYLVLAVCLVTFVVIAQTLKHPVPEGKFEKKDGTLIDIAAFDPVELGPYPKCHPHNKEYLNGTNESGGENWVKNDNAPKAGPFPAGHPENPEWKEKFDKQMKEENYNNRFTWKGLQPNLHLMSMASLCVLIGSLHGVYIFTSPEDGEEGNKENAPQLLQNQDAYMFPVLGSVALFSLFIVYKYLGSEVIKLFISGYVVFMCMAGSAHNAGDVVALIKGKALKPLFVIPFFQIPVNLAEVICIIPAAFLNYTYMVSKNWIINNLFGVSFCVLGMKKIGIPSAKTGVIMLCGLFFYDIFWVFGSKSVFGSNVMVTVAKGVEAPIKLQFARSQDGCGNLEFSMLGLGDIVVPGIYIAFLAKWDAFLQGKSKASSFVYLKTVMVAYVLSLVVTVGVMLLFNAAQPALLYIVPFVLLASGGLALFRGEFKELWEYEIPEESDDQAAAGQASKKDN